MQTVLKDLEARMTSALEALGKDFASVRTGRASTALLDPIRVDYYGNPTPINQMASVSTPDARTLVIQPWEASQLKEIEKAITKADLGIQPVDEMGEAGGAEAGGELPAARGAARFVCRFQHQDAAAALGEAGGGGKAVVAGADNDRIK